MVPLLGGDRGQRLLELGVAVMLAGIGGVEGLLSGGQLRCELAAVVAVVAPGEKDHRDKAGDQGDFGYAEQWMDLHLRCS
jgi:hypothetical protein